MERTTRQETAPRPAPVLTAAEEREEMEGAGGGKASRRGCRRFPLTPLMKSDNRIRERVSKLVVRINKEDIYKTEAFEPSFP